MYYIYHIKGVKWGCSKRLEKRLKQQGYTINDTCEIIEESDLDTAADLEKHLNIKYGYSWRDDQDYRVVLEAGKQSYKYKKRKGPLNTFTKKDCQLGGYITGKKKGEKQQIARRNNIAKLNVYHTCPHCGIHTRGVAYFRYHGDKCKLNPNHQK